MWSPASGDGVRVATVGFVEEAFIGVTLLDPDRSVIGVGIEIGGRGILKVGVEGCFDGGGKSENRLGGRDWEGDALMSLVCAMHGLGLDSSGSVTGDERIGTRAAEASKGCGEKHGGDSAIELAVCGDANSALSLCTVRSGI